MTVLKKIFNKVPADEMSELKDRLLKLCKGTYKTKKSDDLLIDALKVLRIMLEYYRREKKVRVHILSQLFEDKLIYVLYFL
jgi:hypothetical protein